MMLRALLTHLSFVTIAVFKLFSTSMRDIQNSQSPERWNFINDARYCIRTKLYCSLSIQLPSKAAYFRFPNHSVQDCTTTQNVAGRCTLEPGKIPHSEIKHVLKGPSVVCACCCSSLNPRHHEEACRQLAALEPPVFDLPLLCTQEREHTLTVKREESPMNWVAVC